MEQGFQDLECLYPTQLKQLERESNHSPLFHAEVRLLAAASALTYVSMAECYAQGHLIFPPLTIPPRHVRLLFLFLFLLLLLLLVIIIINIIC